MGDSNIDETVLGKDPKNTETDHGQTHLGETQQLIPEEERDEIEQCTSEDMEKTDTGENSVENAGYRINFNIEQDVKDIDSNTREHQTDGDSNKNETDLVTDSKIEETDDHQIELGKIQQLMPEELKTEIGQCTAEDMENTDTEENSEENAGNRINFKREQDGKDIDSNTHQHQTEEDSIADETEQGTDSNIAKNDNQGELEIPAGVHGSGRNGIDQGTSSGDIEKIEMEGNSEDTAGKAIDA